MNKKFSTLAASALLATAFSSLSAQVEFRAPVTKAGSDVTTINQIQGDKWYQLRTADGKFLVQQRDLNTGELLLVAVNPNEQFLPLLPSLWKIEYSKEAGPGAGKFRFINKETNLPLSFDHTKAVDAKGKIDEVIPTATAMNVEGCNTTWEWYLYDKQDSQFGTVAPYSYFHTEKADSVMTLKETNGLVYAVKDAAEKVVNNHIVKGSVVRIQPVVAQPINLMASEINTMIDFHKPAVDKKYASFLFFQPNGNLNDPKALDINFGKNATMEPAAQYQAKTNFASLQSIIDMALDDKKAESAEYKEATAVLKGLQEDLEEAKVTLAEKQKVTLEKLASANYLAQIKQDAEKQNKKAFADLEEGKVVENATKTASALVDAFDRPVVNRTEKFKTLKEKAAKVQSAATDLDKIAAAIECKEFASTFFNSLSYVSRLAIAADYEKANALLNEASVTLYNSCMSSQEKYDLALTNWKEALNAYDTAVKEAQIANLTVIDLKKDVIAAAIALDEIAGGLTEKVRYIAAHNFLQLQYMNDNQGSYLMVDTAFWQSGLNPEDSHLLLAHKTPKAIDHPAITARYFFNFTYCPTQDSLVIEPLNASIISNQEAENEIAWKDAFVGKNLVDAADVNAEKAESASNTWIASAAKSPVVVKANYLATSGWCLTATAADGKAKTLNTRIAFNNPYDYLTRTTLEDGIYLLKNLGKVGAERNIVLNMAGQYTYKNAEKSQEYEHMPAAQWVIEKTSCNIDNKDARVKIVNREYPTRVLFEGHLYTDGNGNVFTLNITDFPWSNYDTVSYKKIEANDFGYLNLKGEEVENAYHINMFLNYGVNDKSLTVVATANDTLLRAVDPASACLFEFLPVAADVEFGYNSTAAKTKQLYKSVYMIKVKDADKINNDHKVVGVNRNGKYCVVDSLDMTDGSYIAYFTLKENNHWDGEHYYSLVEVWDPEFVGGVYDMRKLAVEGSQMDTKESYLDEIHTDAFHLQKDTMPYYRRVADMEMKSVVFNSDNNQNRVLYEKAGFMGVHSVAEETADNTIFVDTAFVAGVSRPTYLLARDVNNFITDTCDHTTHPEGTPVEHWRKVPYMQGRYMIDLGSIASEAIPAYMDATPYAKMYSKYAFVNAIHMGDTLYIMKKANDSIRYQHDLTLLKEKVQYTLPLKKEVLNGAPVSFRLANHEGDMTDGSFYIETTGKKYGFAADQNAWMKEQNNNNVVSTASGKSVDHNNFLITNYEDIYQALLLNLKSEDNPTSNEEISASTIQVLAKEGAIEIVGAAGKKVVISNILGQAVANAVVTSDNATIAVPAGIVVVAVEGEAAVKAIVK